MRNRLTFLGCLVCVGLVNCVQTVDPTPHLRGDDAKDAAQADSTTPDMGLSRDEDAMDSTMNSEGPTWSEEATIEVIASGENDLTLSWSRAEDADGVAAYVIYQDGDQLGVVGAEERALKVGQLSAGTAYVFRVDAEDILGNRSKVSLVTTAETLDETPPAWTDEAYLAGSVVADSTVILSWGSATDNVGVAGYRIYRDNHEIGTSPGETKTFEVTSLKPWTTYIFRIEAYDMHGNESFGGPQWTFKSADATSPTWPDGASLVVSQVTPTSCYLGWDGGLDDVSIAGYRVFQDKVKLVEMGADVTWFKVVNLAPWKSYEFQVHAVDNAGNQTVTPLSIDVSTPDEEAPTWGMQSSLLASNPTDAGVTLGWTAATDDVEVTGYRLFRDNIEIGSFEKDTLATDVTGLKKTTAYVFRVEAVDAAGNLSFDGPMLVLDLSDKTPPVWPIDALFEASTVTPVSVALTWSSATDNVAVAGYQIRESGQIVAATSSGQTNVAITGLSPLTPYTFSLEATDAAGNINSFGSLLDIETPDFPQPKWPDDASLEASVITDSQVTLTWSSLEVEVDSYQIYQDSAWIVSVPSSDVSATISGLSPLTSYIFGIEATGPSGKVSSGGPTLTVTTLDVPAPTWPEDAQLVAKEINDSTLSLTWTALHETQAVETYEIRRNGLLVAFVEVPEHATLVEAPLLGESVIFTVEAIGPTGLVSFNGPSIEVATKDETAPTWTDKAVLEAKDITDSAVTLSWSGAVDNVSVATYRLYVDGEIDVDLDANVTFHKLSGLAPATDYLLRMEALDEAGNESMDGPSLSITTVSGNPDISDQMVFDALKPTCALCHSTWFNSLTDFQNYVANNASFVVPGEPDQSLLILYLEENGPGSGQMPPSFFDADGDSYMDMSEKGETSLTVEEIRQWISEM